MSRHTRIRVRDDIRLYTEKMSEEDIRRYEEMMEEVDRRIKLPVRQKELVRSDMLKAVNYLLSIKGVPFSEIAERLDPEKFGDFYSEPNHDFYPLDNAAKIYPISMKHGEMPIFRLACYLKEDVVPEILQMALLFTIKRFPGFATYMKKGFFWHYLDSSKIRYAVEEEGQIPCRPIKLYFTGSQAFRVMYYRNRISCEFFHALTDGAGGLIFIKTLVGEYLRIMGNKAGYGEGVRDINEKPPLSETENNFAKTELQPGVSGFMGVPVLQLKGKISQVRPERMLHFEMSSASLKEAAHHHDCTVTAFMLAVMFNACKLACDKTSGSFCIQVPINMRKFNQSDTLRNYSMYFGVEIPIEDIDSIAGIIPEIKRQIAEKSTEENMTRMMSTTVKLISTFRYLPLVLMEPAAKVVYGYLGDRIFTTVLSNIGITRMPEEYYEEIQKYEFCLGPSSVNRVNCGMITFNDAAVFSITKSTVDDSFEQGMYDLLTEEGVEVKVTGTQDYES